MNTFFRMSQVNNMKKMAYALLAMHLLATNGLHAGPFKSIFARMNELEQQMSRLHEDLLKDFADISDDLLSDFALEPQSGKRVDVFQSTMTHKAGHALTYDKNDDYVSLKLSGVDVDPERIDSYATHESVDVTVPEKNGTTRVTVTKQDYYRVGDAALWTVNTNAEKRSPVSKPAVKDLSVKTVVSKHLPAGSSGALNVTTPAIQDAVLSQEQYLKGEDLMVDENRTTQQFDKQEGFSKVDALEDAPASEATDNKVALDNSKCEVAQCFSSYQSSSSNMIPGNFDMKNPEIEYNQTTKELVIKLMRVKEDPAAHDIVHKVAVKRVK